MHTRFERGGPRGCRDGGSLVVRALERLEVDHEGDGVLGVGDTLERLASGDTGSGTGNNTSGDGDVLKNPATDVHVVRGEVVAIERILRWLTLSGANAYVPNIGVLSGPCLERLELALGLSHPGVEKVELPKGGDTCLCVAICGVVSSRTSSLASEIGSLDARLTACDAQPSKRHPAS